MIKDEKFHYANFLLFNSSLKKITNCWFSQTICLILDQFYIYFWFSVLAKVCLTLYLSPTDEYITNIKNTLSSHSFKVVKKWKFIKKCLQQEWGRKVKKLKSQNKLAAYFTGLFQPLGSITEKCDKWKKAGVEKEITRSRNFEKISMLYKTVS